MTAVVTAQGGEQGRQPVAQLRTSSDLRTLREVHRLLASSGFASAEERAEYEARTRLSPRVTHGHVPAMAASDHDSGSDRVDPTNALPRRH